jgi:CubicO group peptidase (beta-lactamase class C family)
MGYPGFNSGSHSFQVLSSIRFGVYDFCPSSCTVICYHWGNIILYKSIVDQFRNALPGLHAARQTTPNAFQDRRILSYSSRTGGKINVWNWTKTSMSSVLAAILIPGILFMTIGPIPAAGVPENQVAAHALQGFAPSTDPITAAERIDQFVSQQVKRHGIPGLALALVDEKQIIFMKGYGKADQTGRPVTPKTPFILASASKPHTAVAVMQLVEAGIVDLDAPVQRYIPEFTLADSSASRQITVRHLLLHASGLPATACDTRTHAGTLAEYVAEIQNVEPAAPVGTRHIYCSGNYNLLGRIIEKASGQPFGKYMQEHVFTPLEMRQSFKPESPAQQAGLAQGYQWLFGLPLPTHHAYNPSQLPSGYMISSVEDIGHFLISQMNEGQYMGTSVVLADAVAAMQVPGTERGGEGGYGIGWVISSVGGVPAVWHDRVNDNYHSLVLMLPEQRRGMVVLMNSFGIVPYESAYKEIEAGITQFLRPKYACKSLFTWNMNY